MSLKALAVGALKAAKTTAVATKNLAVKTVKNLNKLPTSIKCSNCPLTLQVPEGLFDWYCESDKCEGKQVNKHEDKACTSCMAPKPKLDDPIIRCDVCKHETVVPTSNASKHFNSAKTTVGKAATKVKDYSQRKYAEMKSAPKSVKCLQCTAKIELDPKVFEWACAKCNHKNESGAKACEECEEVRPKDLPEVKVDCPTCNNENVVPRSVAAVHLNSAKRTVKSVTTKVSTFAKEQYAKQRAIPKEFNCKKCNKKVETPAKLLEAAEAKAASNEEGKISNVTELMDDPDMWKMDCPHCKMETDIPKSNFTNSVKSGYKSMGRVSQKLIYDVSKKPYVVCTKCGTNLEVVAASEEQGGGFSATCKTCGTEFTPEA